MRHEPEDRDDREREGQRDEECHLMVAIELIDNHQQVDIAEWYKTEGKDTQGLGSLRYHSRFIRSEETGDGTGEEPYTHTGDEHGDGDKPEGA